MGRKIFKVFILSLRLLKILRGNNIIKPRKVKKICKNNKTSSETSNLQTGFRIYNKFLNGRKLLKKGERCHLTLKNV